MILKESTNKSSLKLGDKIAMFSDGEQLETFEVVGITDIVGFNKRCYIFEPANDLTKENFDDSIREGGPGYEFSYLTFGEDGPNYFVMTDEDWRYSDYQKI